MSQSSIRRLGRRGVVAVTAVGIIAAGAVGAAAEITTPNPESLKAVGPVGAYGFPVWYEDSNGTKLEQCLDVTEPLCDPGFLTGEGLDPAKPLAIESDATLSNFPGESFYSQAESTMDVPGGTAGFVSALEATFANEEPKDGDQVVFGRIRIRVDTPVAGTYTVTHPYGVDTFEVQEADRADGINMTEDITPAPENFGLALGSRVAPFLEREAGRIEQPDGDVFLGDPAETTRVKGSPLGTNFFRIEGPAGFGTVETDVFSVLGKVSTNSGVEVEGAYYTETPSGVFVDAYAKAGVNDAVELSGTGLPQTTMAANGEQYFARVAASSVPAEVTITNSSDRPAAVKKVPVVDNVQITNAVYENGTLTVAARSSDHDAKLSFDGQELTGSIQVTGVPIPPRYVTVTSDGKGSDTAPVVVLGAEAGQVVEQTAVIAGPSSVAQGQVVTLSGASSVNATGYSWRQTAGPDVGVTGKTTADVSFTAPQAAGQLSFELTTSGPQGPKTAAHTVTVLDQAEAPTVSIASSVTNPEVGQSVTLTATTTNDSSFEWTQPDGQNIQIADPKAKAFTFTMPATSVKFTATVTSPSGTPASADIEVVPNTDTLTVTSAELRTGRTEWRIVGRASVTNLNSVTVYLQSTDADGNPVKGSAVGTATVDTLGDWTVRTRNGVRPGGATMLIVESSKGGYLENVRFTTRR